MDWESADAIDLRVPSWNDWQSEGKRYGSTSWMRLDNGIPHHELWEELSGDEFKIMIGVFCFLSQKFHKDGRASRVRWSTLERFTGYSKPKLISAFRKLTLLGITVIAPCENSACTVIAPCEHSDKTVLRNGTERNDTQRDEEAPAARAAPDIIITPFVDVATRLGLGEKFRALWRGRVDEGWLTEQLRQLETELDAPGNPYAHKPVVVRANEYLEKRLKNRDRPETARAGPKYGPDIPTVEEFAKAKGAS